jgi:hypothetical protein
MEAHRKQLEMDEQAKLDRLNKILSDQAQKDKERIEYRNKMLANKMNMLKNQKQLKLTEHEQKEKILEKITQARKPHINSDPVRMISYTEAVLNRRGVSNQNKNNENDDTKYEDKKELYNNYSFNDKQLNADARIRLEQKLRQAGLMTTDYARELISNVKPPTNPRKDNFSANWDGFAMKNQD